MSVLLNALKKAAAQQPPAVATPTLHQHPVSSLTLTPKNLPEKTLPWERIAQRGVEVSNSSHLLQQRLDAMQKKVSRHQQQLADYHQLLAKIIPPIDIKKITADAPSNAAIAQLFSQQVDTPSWQPPKLFSLLSSICLIGLVGLAAVVWQKDWPDVLKDTAQSTSPIAQTHTSKIAESKPIEVQPTKQVQSTEIAIQPAVETAATIETPTIDDVPIVFVEPRIQQQPMSIVKNNAPIADPALPITAADTAEQFLQNTQTAWSQQNKRGAAQAFKQYRQAIEQQPAEQQASAMQAGFQQLYNNGYFELALYLLQTDLQQGPLPSISIYHLFKLIPELPLETLEPFFVSLSKQHPHNSLLYFGLGNLYAFHQNWQSALTQFMLATQHDPRNADAFFNAAITAEHLQKNAQALQAYEQALKLSHQRTYSFPSAIATERLALLKRQLNQ
jgi:hypothetical protein